jgi:hypothetical protein
MAKRSKKKAAFRGANKAASNSKGELVRIASYTAECLRKEDPQEYFALRTKAYEDAMVMHIANEAAEKAYAMGNHAGGKVVTDNIGTTFTSAMCLALNELYGFGKKRLCDIMDRMNTIMLETFTTADAVQKVYKQLGLRFSEEDPFHWLNYEEDEAL